MISNSLTAQYISPVHLLLVSLGVCDIRFLLSLLSLISDFFFFSFNIGVRLSSSRRLSFMDLARPPGETSTHRQNVVSQKHRVAALRASASPSPTDEQLSTMSGVPSSSSHQHTMLPSIHELHPGLPMHSRAPSPGSAYGQQQLSAGTSYPGSSSNALGMLFTLFSNEHNNKPILTVKEHIACLQTILISREMLKSPQRRSGVGRP